MENLSLVVITYNEEDNIGRCLKSAVDTVDDILVVDSFSQDQTVSIARECGARIIQRPFEGYIEQKRFAIEQALYDRVLVLDADEALDEQLRLSVNRIKNNWTHDCYRMNRMSNIEGQWIRHGGWYPDPKMRLFDRKKYQIVGVNPHDKFTPLRGASVKHLPGNILHYTNSNITDRIHSINKLSSVAAQAFFDRGKRGSCFRLLIKPSFRFIQEYFLKRGFLDGFYGCVIAKTSAQYVFLREAKLMSLTKAEKG